MIHSIFSLSEEKSHSMQAKLLRIFLSIHPFIWDPGQDNSYSDCGMLIRWKKVCISYLHFNWEIWPRYIICFNVICVRVLKEWQYITVLDKRRGIKGEGTIQQHGFQDINKCKYLLLYGSIKLPSYSWFSCLKLFAFCYWHWRRILAHLLALKCSFYNRQMQQIISVLTSPLSVLAMIWGVCNERSEW